MANLTTEELSSNIQHTPLIIHINPIGLIRTGKNNVSRFLKLNTVLNKIKDYGGNMAVPAYSYTYTKNEIYDLVNTPSDLNEISEYLRANNKDKRTADANFSYLLFGDGFSNRHFSVSDYSSFGEGSLIDEVYNKDGYLGAIGGALEYLTEIHYLERKLNVSYRFDKIFKGASISTNGKVVNNQVTYFCRDLEADYSVSFVQLKEDIRLEGLVKIWRLEEYSLKIEVVKIQELYAFIKEKLLNNPEYLWKKISE
jgi:aminoglycoside 3-N-acetyltransferase